MDCSMMSFTLKNPLSPYFIGITLAVYLVTASTLPQLLKDFRNKRRFLLFYILTGAASLGIFAAADFFTLFCFFEIMTLCSFAYVGCDESQASRKAAMSYLMYGILGGLVMLFGLMLIYWRFGTLSFQQLADTSFAPADTPLLYTAGSCLLFGFGAKAGMFPLHTWLPKTYTAAPCAGTTVLSAVLSKTGIYGILMVSICLFQNNPAGGAWGAALSILGCLTMFTGGLLGLFSTNVKRTLACSSMSQIGFILVAIGCSDSLAALLHTVNHSLFKLILFTIVSFLFGMTGELDYNRLAGFANRKWWLKLPFLCAALGISGIPLFSGFVSKTLIHHGIETCMHIPAFADINEYGVCISFQLSPYADVYKGVEWIFLISGGMTFAYMLKMYFALFHNHPQEESCREDTCIAKPGSLSVFLLYAFGFLCPAIGLYPDALQLLPVWENLKGILISLSIGTLIYLIFIRTCTMKQEGREGGSYIRYIDIYPSWLDIEELVYKPIFLKILPFIGALFSRAADRLMDALSIFIMKTLLRPRGRSHVRNDHPLAYAAGKLADAVFTLVHVKIRKKPPVSRASYADLFTVGSTEFTRAARLVLYSVSFGLLLFALGLTATLVYLLATLQ